MKKWVWWAWLVGPMVPVVILVAVAFALTPSHESRTMEYFEEHREILEELALLTLEQGSAEGIVPPSPWRGVELHRSGIHTVEFDMGGSGLGSSTTYWGVNYIPSDSTMVGFQGRRWDHWKEQGEGRLYYDPEGDNTCYVRKLDECWYYYEMKF